MEQHNHTQHKTNPEVKTIISSTSAQQYTCPMHSQIIRNEPGNCPLCGMNLVPVKKSESGHAVHNMHSSMIDDFRKRFYVVLVLAIPIMLLSQMIQHWLNLHISFPGSQYVLFALSTVVFIYGGFLFLKGLVDEVKQRIRA